MTDRIAADLDALVPLATSDAMLSQRLIGAVAALRSKTAGDDLNTPPPPLPDTWTSDSLTEPTRTELAEHLNEAAAQLRQLDATADVNPDVSEPRDHRGTGDRVAQAYHSLIAALRLSPELGRRIL